MTSYINGDYTAHNFILDVEILPEGFRHYSTKLCRKPGMNCLLAFAKVEGEMRFG